MTDYTKGEQCSAQVYEPSGFGRFHQCSKKAVVERDGKPYCKIHDPEFVKAKREAKETEWDKEWAERRANIERQHLLASIFKGIDTKTIEVNINKYKSAPDLYEACKQALRTFEAHSIRPTDSRYRILEQAIAKADKLNP